MPTLRVSLGIGLANASQKDEIEIDEDEWGECENDEEREKLINQYAQDWAWNYIEIDADLVKEQPTC
jgi:hypothetical protein